MNLADAVRQVTAGTYFRSWNGTLFKVITVRHPVEGVPVARCHELNKHGQYERWRFIRLDNVSQIVEPPA